MASVTYTYEFTVDPGKSMNTIVGRVPVDTQYVPPTTVVLTYDPALTTTEQAQLDGFMTQQGFLRTSP